MKKAFAVSTFLVISLFLVTGFVVAGQEEVVQAIVNAKIGVKPLANPSASLPDLTVEQAYELQRKAAEAMVKKGHAISGYKAGLTAKPVQKKFGVDEALLGPLFKTGELSEKKVLDRKTFMRPFIETEIGYFFATKVDKPVKDVAGLKKLVKEVCPAIELPDLRYSDLKNLKGQDIVSDGVASAGYIVGTRMPADKVDVANLKVTLAKDGKVVFQGKASDALGDQWQALLWLVNGVVKQGWTIEPGQILITGALGKMIPAKPGKYEANFGELGLIVFNVQ